MRKENPKKTPSSSRIYKQGQDQGNVKIQTKSKKKETSSASSPPYAARVIRGMATAPP
jgi:hypothetical protein